MWVRQTADITEQEKKDEERQRRNGKYKEAKSHNNCLKIELQNYVGINTKESYTDIKVNSHMQHCANGETKENRWWPSPECSTPFPADLGDSACSSEIVQAILTVRISDAVRA